MSRTMVLIHGAWPASRFEPSELRPRPGARPPAAPLLITAGEHDNTVPKGVARAAYDKYAGNGATTGFVEFPRRSHLLVSGPGREEVAGYVEGRLDKVLDGAPAATA
jgi:alpha-beta hydrolase superfamily lysophospholipase